MKVLLLSLLLPSSLLAQAEAPVVLLDHGKLPSRIAFGSCASQKRPLPIFHTIVQDQPELFLFLGDNIYGDTHDMEVLQQKYQVLANKPDFQKLRATTPILATWDDHDYGLNDGGKGYKMKKESRALFLDFWKVPADSPQRAREGIYGAHLLSDGEHTLQVIILDTRTFRDPLAKNDGKAPHKNAYRPDPTPEKTFLGEAQWQWLEKTLRQPADLRLVASSIQFGHEYNGWESWTNLPSEQKRFLDLIKTTRAEGVIFLSGDVHWGEISVREQIPDLYPLIDITSSGLNQTWPTLEPNKYRHGPAMRDYNYGFLEIDWTQPDPALTLSVRGIEGQTAVQKALKLSEIQFSPPKKPRNPAD